MTVCRDGKYSTVLNRFACICLEFLSERRRAQKVTVCSTGAEGPAVGTLRSLRATWQRPTPPRSATGSPALEEGKYLLRQIYLHVSCHPVSKAMIQLRLRCYCYQYTYNHGTLYSNFNTG